MLTIVQDLRYASAIAVGQSQLCRRGGADARARHRRQLDDLQLGSTRCSSIQCPDRHEPRQVKINSQPFTIVGVAAPGFFGAVSGLSYDMWLPMGTQPAVMPGGDRLKARGSRWLGLIGRLAPGTSPEQARAELDATIAQMRTTWVSQGRYIDHQAAVFALDHSPDGAISVLRPVLLILMAVAAIVLLITCANLAGLLLARAHRAAAAD